MTLESVMDLECGTIEHPMKLIQSSFSFYKLSHEVHGIPASGELEREGLVKDVLGAFDGEAIGSEGDATWNGVAGGGNKGRRL